jgi:carbamoyl-phosphate synthase large subunit
VSVAAERTPVLVAGIGGASLGSEILKSLRHAGVYEIFACDISPLAFGHYVEGLAGTFLPDKGAYAESVLQACVTRGIRVVVPGAEEPLVMLSRAAERFAEAGIAIAGNTPEVVAVCTDKSLLFERLAALGIAIPRTVVLRKGDELPDLPVPLIVKPAVGSGGSSFVFLASDLEEAAVQVRLILENRDSALVQEYVALDEGEFTVGVLSGPDGMLMGSVALRRLLESKLSVSMRSAAGVISSGYSQGLIEDAPGVRSQADRIALALGSRGPINIQGRVRGGVLMPFEINPRFSASTYLRTLAGFNEVHIFLEALLHGRRTERPRIREGYYLRSLTETYVSREQVKA